MFADDVSGAAVGPIFNGHRLNLRQSPAAHRRLRPHPLHPHIRGHSNPPFIYASTYYHWRWDPQRLPKRRRQTSYTVPKPQNRESVSITRWKCKNQDLECKIVFKFIRVVRYVYSQIEHAHPTVWMLSLGRTLTHVRQLHTVRTTSNLCDHITVASPVQPQQTAAIVITFQSSLGSSTLSLSFRSTAKKKKKLYLFSHTRQYSTNLITFDLITIIAHGERNKSPSSLLNSFKIRFIYLGSKREDENFWTGL
jgi:hypothetical protein